MTRHWLFPSILALLVAAPAMAQDEAAGPDPDLVANSSIVWLKPGNAIAPIREGLIKKNLKVLNFSDEFEHLVVEGHPSRLQRQLEEDDELSPAIDHVEPNGIVRLFPSECVPIQRPMVELIPPGVRRVRGPMELPAGLARRVWVIDSGIAEEYDARAGGELNVDRSLAAECTANGCVQGTAGDKLGHGTAVASIIGAIQDGKGLVGVAPGALLVPIRVFASEEADWASIYPAMAWLMARVQPGDVVNVSFGGPWDPSATGQPRMIERQLRRLADQGVRVAVAAGNLDALPHSAYVQTVSPARAGAYRNAASGGAVMTVSAVDDQDRFWPESGFGNGEAAGGLQLGPPDVAEPGVAIPALWPGGGMRACTGTSFAAPHLAGILLQGLPEHDGQVTGDIDAAMDSPSGAQQDAAKNDPIGACVRDKDGICRVR